MTSSREGRSKLFNMRMTHQELEELHALASSKGYRKTSDLVRALIAAEARIVTDPRRSMRSNESIPRPTEHWRSKLGKMMLGDSIGLLGRTLKPSSVDLIVTSPPFGLVTKKAYGNVSSNEYLKWFEPFAVGMKRVLKPTGSLVIDIGPAWNQGLPTKSTYQFDLLLMLCKDFGFHLAQDFYWWNPSRMPAPAEWVNIRRLRAKDAVNPVWWLSPTPWPKAGNKRVLTPYSESQRALFKNGYNAGRRPSGHVVSDVWGRDNGGSVPSNLIAAPNTSAADPYQKYCNANGLPIHPARFPWAIPEFFVRMLTDKNDLVVDPFAGSCITGAVAEFYGRRWVCGELRKEYLDGAIGRFESLAAAPSLREQYAVPTVQPYSAQESALLPCGGRDFRQKPNAPK